MCGDPPKEFKNSNNTLFQEDIKGEASIISKRLGSGSVDAEIKKGTEVLYQKYTNIDKTLIDSYFMYMVCIIITNDKNTTSETKINQLVQFHKELFSKAEKDKEQIANELSDTKASLSRIESKIQKLESVNQKTKEKIAFSLDMFPS
ncbi:hypothetical protein [Methylomagnum ishizawai]|uniref:hypothetical protein n=1 Tax=Methylomagnum ishizawai TaxID=1760988 RepID=UPI000F7452C9|nr:hypothetical protein [Methylomagnum ishizawai]